MFIVQKYLFFNILLKIGNWKYCLKTYQNSFTRMTRVNTNGKAKCDCPLLAPAPHNGLQWHWSQPPAPTKIASWELLTPAHRPRNNGHIKVINPDFLWTMASPLEDVPSCGRFIPGIHCCTQSQSGVGTIVVQPVTSRCVDL